MLNLAALYLLIFFGLSLVWTAAAQASTNVSCTTAQWTFNDEDQSPCQVGASLEQACTGGMLNVAPLTPGNAYSGPRDGESNNCICSSVTFSLISACAACQGGSTLTWNTWIKNCSQSDISISKYPLTIPLNTSVPSWAYINVSISGVWDVSAAETNHSAGAPDSSAGMPMPTATKAPSSSPSHSSHTGAIAGGVVGGVVGAALAFLAVYVLCRRSYYARGAAVDQFQHEETDYRSSTPPKLAAEYITVPTQPHFPPKLYNPSDPSTFPPTPQPSLPAYTISGYAGSDVTSPITGPFSPTSTSHSLISDHHSRNLSGGTTASTAMQSAQHGRNLSGGTTTSSVLQGQVGYSGVPEI